MRLAEPLAVTSVVSNEFGRLLFFRIRNDDSLIVNLPVSAQHGTVLTSRHRLQRPPSDAGARSRDCLARAQQDDDSEADALARSEPNFLLSSRAAWYPQNVITDYARARIRITVPEGMAAWRAASFRRRRLAARRGVVRRRARVRSSTPTSRFATSRSS